MHVLIDDRWTPGYLDATPQSDEYVLSVTHWVVIAPVSELFFERPRSISLVVDYVRDVGLRPTLRRIRSRQAERVRNRRFLCVGLGRVLRRPDASPHELDEVVAFVAPKAPQCADRVVVHQQLVFEPPPELPRSDARVILHARDEQIVRQLNIGGWDPWSGMTLTAEEARLAGEICKSVLSGTRWETAGRLPATDEPLRTRAPGRGRPRDSRPTAVLYGLGNYAKTTILPNVKSSLDVRAIHELDPLQIGPRSDKADVEWCTDPHGDLAPYDVVLVAGYHHTHAELAERALLLGKSVVVEKPLATSCEQLRRLSDVAVRSEGRLFVCFQRRYTQLNDYARHDLQARPGDPIHYHCVVFEEPLPPRHWYRWPVSGSRLLSNGCHWIDHFLHLNAYCPPTRVAVEAPRDDVVNVTAALENGAVFTMVLTDVGSQRLGVRETIELRSGDVTVRMSDGKRYESESSQRHLRRRTVTKFAAQQRMYESIGAMIAERREGEAVAHNLLSARVTLELDDKLRQASTSSPTQ